jgi:hypothetical protein
MAHSVLLVYEADWDRCEASEKEHDGGLIRFVKEHHYSSYYRRSIAMNLPKFTLLMLPSTCCDNPLAIQS